MPLPQEQAARLPAFFQTKTGRSEPSGSARTGHPAKGVAVHRAVSKLRSH